MSSDQKQSNNSTAKYRRTVLHDELHFWPHRLSDWAETLNSAIRVETQRVPKYCWYCWSNLKTGLLNYRKFSQRLDHSLDWTEVSIRRGMWTSLKNSSGSNVPVVSMVLCYGCRVIVHSYNVLSCTNLGTTKIDIFFMLGPMNGYWSCCRARALDTSKSVPVHYFVYFLSHK